MHLLLNANKKTQHYNQQLFMRLKFRNLYQMPRNEPLSSLQSSNRSIVIQTYDKVDHQSQCQSIPSYKRTIDANNLQYSSFQKKLKDYKENLLHLLEKSKNQKECYMKRMIDLTNQSKSRISSSRDNYTSISVKYASRTPLGYDSTRSINQNYQKPNHALRPCKSPKLDNSRLSNKSDLKFSRNKDLKKSRKDTISHSREKSHSRSSSKCALNGSSISPRQMNQTHKLMRRKEELEEELKRLNQNIMMRQKVKSKLSIL